jgi:outer membrane protein TolC
MKMKITAYKKVLPILLISSNLLTGISQQTADSLLKYKEIADRNNPEVLLKFNDYQAALQKVPQAGSLNDPELSAGVFLTPMELMSGNQLAEFTLMQMFPWFGVLSSAKDEMSLMAKAKYEVYLDSKLQVGYDLQRTWYELYKIRKQINISEKNIAILKSIETIAITRYKSAAQTGSAQATQKPALSSASSPVNNGVNGGMEGMGSGKTGTSTSGTTVAGSSMEQGSMGTTSGVTSLDDLYQIQIETGELQNNIESLRSLENTIRARFNSYLNRKPETSVSTPEILIQDSLGIPVKNITDSLHTNNPMLVMLKYEKLSLEAREKMVSRMGYPMVGAGINYSLINKAEMSTSPMNGKDMIMPMVKLTLPIYRRKYNAMRTEAELNKTSVDLNYSALVNSLQNEFYQAIQLLQDSERRIKLYSSQFELSVKSLNLKVKSFSVSSAGLTDVLRLRQQTLDYEYKQTEAVTEYNTAVAWIRRLGNLNNSSN